MTQTVQHPRVIYDLVNVSEVGVLIIWFGQYVYPIDVLESYRSQFRSYLVQFLLYDKLDLNS